MVCGAIVVAVAIEEIIAHPGEAAHVPTVLVAVIGPLIFPTGNALFRRSIGRPVPGALGVAAGTLVLIGAVVHLTHAPAPVLGVGALIPLLVLAYLLGRHAPAAHHPAPA